jgi:hypothetical protein
MCCRIDEVDKVSPPELPGLSHVAINRPSVSASKITSGYTYDPFAHVCCAGTYVSNTRIQRLIDAEAGLSELEIAVAVERMKDFILSTDTFGPIRKGSETAIVDVNLQRLLKEFVKPFGTLSCEKKDVSASDIYMASGMSPEHSIYGIEQVGYDQVLVGAEVKGTEASIRECYAQLIALSANSCLHMFRCKLPREDCVVPGIAMAGNTCQFLATYLIGESFPVVVALSDLLEVNGPIVQRREIARWMHKLFTFAAETITLLQRRTLLPMALTAEIDLDIKAHFFKPISVAPKISGRVGNHNRIGTLKSPRTTYLNDIMTCYQQLFKANIPGQDSSKARDTILFPHGVITVPRKSISETTALRKCLMRTITKFFQPMNYSNCPLIVYPMLSEGDGWTNGKPPAALCELYLAKLRLAVDLLNAARVAHLDLRPENVMWRRVTDIDCACGSIGIELKVIDFEFALMFGQVVPKLFVDSILNTKDRRYPFTEADRSRPVLANKLHNDFFLHAISEWLRSKYSRGFSDYMFERS